jgi:hypothetical protein
MLIVHVVTLARFGVLPEDGPLGTETCRSFIGIFSILMCVNMFRIACLKTIDTDTSSWLFYFCILILARYKNEKNDITVHSNFN